jgi:hypothetical protein
VYGVYKEANSAAGSQIYFHDTISIDGWSGYVIANDTLGFGLQVSYEKKNLPELINWVDLESGRNVVEVGPSNCKCFGRKQEREAGTLQWLEPGETKDYKIKFKVLDGLEDLQKAEKYFKK